MGLLLKPDTSTRMRLLLLLKAEGSGTVKQLAKALEVTGVSVRRHLDLLEKDGVVRARMQKLQRGRPMKVYLLTEEAERIFPQGYSRFALGILKQVEARFGSRAVNKLIGGYMDGLIQQIRPRTKGRPLKTRVEELAGFMDSQGFLATYEQRGANEYVLIQSHCPLLRIAAECPALCAHELRMHKRILGADVRRECFIQAGGQACRYVIRGE